MSVVEEASGHRDWPEFVREFVGDRGSSEMIPSSLVALWWRWLGGKEEGSMAIKYGIVAGRIMGAITRIDAENPWQKRQQGEGEERVRGLKTLTGQVGSACRLKREREGGSRHSVTEWVRLRVRIVFYGVRGSGLDCWA